MEKAIKTTFTTPLKSWIIFVLILKTYGYVGLLLCTILLNQLQNVLKKIMVGLFTGMK